MSYIDYEALLEMWEKSLEKNKQFLQFVDLPTDNDKSDLIVNLYKPKHCGVKNNGNNMISNEKLTDVVRKKPNAKALLLCSCIKITPPGISCALSILNKMTVLVLDEMKLSHDMLTVIADKVKTLHVLSLFAFAGDVSDESLEAVAQANPDLKWFILPGLAYEDMKITSKSVSKIVKYCPGLKKISMPPSLFDDQAVSSMIEYLQPTEFELLDVREMGEKKEVKGVLLKHMFEMFPLLKVEEESLLQIQPHILRKADIPLGFESIKIEKDEHGHSVPPDEFLRILNGKHICDLKKLSITKQPDIILKALINNGLQKQIKEMDFGFGGVMLKSTQELLEEFIHLEKLDLAFNLSDGSDYVSTKDVVQMLSKMMMLKELDLSGSAISPAGVEEIVATHPTLVFLKMEGCAGEGFDYTEFLMGIRHLKCLNRPGFQWVYRNKMGERSGRYRELARCDLEALGMDTGR